MKKISLNELLAGKKQESYQKQYEDILRMIREEKLRPIASSGKNGKTPALYLEYWVISEKKDDSVLEEELLYQTNPLIAVDYYLRNLSVYEEEREEVRLLHFFLTEKQSRLKIPVSFNERCFEIWGYEKFLSKASGKTLLRHCGLDLPFLNCYPTAEPFAYFAATREIPQKILILENKDPFFSMRRRMLSGKTDLFGEKIGTLIYGAGKRVISSFEEFSVSAEPYLQNPENTFLYFGDLDYEGIGIYEKLAETFASQSRIVPFVPAYLAMLEKAETARRLPEMKEQQNRNIRGVFFSSFSEDTVLRMKKILEQNLYLPQEIVNISDF